ncbi:DUF4190 domain-containing protein [Pseudonocardia phyllosphaerae]|uniref:DUF4190 domain-containing protein n=1 Tax=Pseudonocardia phyllosphaerae TaxID=3390502 RepID=UPI00397BD09C
MTTSQSPQQGDQNIPTGYPQQPQGGYPYSYAPQQGYGPQQGGPAEIPQQWAPPGYAPQPPAGWGPPPAPAPRNGLGIAALCLGIVGILFGMIPFTGFIAFGLGAVGLILGLVGLGRARKKVATNLKTAIAGGILSIIAIALGIWGMVIVFTGLSKLSDDLNNIPTASAPSISAGTGAVPADVSTPYSAAPTSYKLEVTGTAKKMMLSYSNGSATSSDTDYKSLPWSKTVETSGDFQSAMVSAASSGPGSITCTVTDVATGRVVDTKTAKSLDNSEYSSANVSCSSLG